MPHITKRLVDGVAPAGARLYIWDDEVRGFGLVVQPSGAKSYCYQYRATGGRTRRITLGAHGTLTPDLARTMARQHAQLVATGGDPLSDKRQRQQAMSVGELLSDYLESGRFLEKAPSTQAIDRGRIERHLRPHLGNKIVRDLTPEDIRRAFKAISAGVGPDGSSAVRKVKTKPRGLARVTGGEGTARMAIRLLRAVFEWAREQGIAQTNPCAGVKIGHDGRRTATVENGEAYTRLFQTIKRLQDEKKLRGPVADAIRVIALTGARRGEIVGLKWSHVNLSAGVLELPPTAHKTGRTTGDTRKIGLPAAVRAIIAAQPAAGADDFVFRSATGDGQISLSKPWRLVRREAGLSKELGLHGLRHSLATQMAVNGAQAAEIMAVLGHRNLSTSQRYVHVAQDARADLAERAAAGISAALTGSPTADVVTLHDAARKAS